MASLFALLKKLIQWQGFVKSSKILENEKCIFSGFLMILQTLTIGSTFHAEQKVRPFSQSTDQALSNGHLTFVST